MPDMAVNQLLQDHQLAMLNAQHARSDEDHVIYSDLAAFYGELIYEWRRAAGLPEAGWPSHKRSAPSVDGVMAP